MKHSAIARSFVAAVVLALASGAPAPANENPSFKTPSYSGAETPAEKEFVANAQGYLEKHFPTAADAEKAGYVRYTGEDDTGAISYANQHWQSAGWSDPSQLWYDKNGQLLGVDYARLKTGSTPPQLWGINPGRWWEFDRHMHYVTKNPSTGTVKYDQYLADDDWLAAGGSLTNPQAQTLVAMGKVKTANEVVTVFNFPMIWDLIVWIKPNPNGAFAEKNPNVTP